MPRQKQKPKQKSSTTNSAYLLNPEVYEQFLKVYLKERLEIGLQNQTDRSNEEEQLDLELKKLEIEHKKIEIKSKKGTYLSPLVTAIAAAGTFVITSFNLFFKPEVRPERIILVKEERTKELTPNGVKNLPKSEPPDFERLVNKVTLKIPEVSAKFETAYIQIVSGENPSTVQRKLVQELENVKLQYQGAYLLGYNKPRSQNQVDLEVVDAIKSLDSLTLKFKIPEEGNKVIVWDKNSDGLAFRLDSSRSKKYRFK